MTSRGSSRELVVQFHQWEALSQIKVPFDDNDIFHYPEALYPPPPGPIRWYIQNSSSICPVIKTKVTQNVFRMTFKIVGP